MTWLLLQILRLYRRWLSPVLHSLTPGSCKYLPTCSEYAEVAILRHGPIKGVLLAAWRILRCNPFSKGGLDQVPAIKAKVPPSHKAEVPHKSEKSHTDAQNQPEFIRSAPSPITIEEAHYPVSPTENRT
jgi:putative membrane protein insertion efficiency factor